LLEDGEFNFCTFLKALIRTATEAAFAKLGA
jgi:hypothetical protein